MYNLRLSLYSSTRKITPTATSSHVQVSAVHMIRTGRPIKAAGALINFHSRPVVSSISAPRRTCSLLCRQQSRR